jgi:hypothetical protein
MDAYLQALKRRYQSTGSYDDLERYTLALERLVGGVSPLPLPEENPVFGPEAVVQTVDGIELRTDVFPNPVSYLRVVDSDGEIAYWTVDEIVEDPDAVLGAIMGALIGGRNTEQ